MQAEKIKISAWAKDDRPREKLLSKSPSALSDAELLAILLGQGTPRKNVIEVSREIMQLVDNDLSQLGRLTIKEMRKIEGIGLAKAITITAAMELGRRRQMAGLAKNVRVGTSRQVASCLQGLLGDQSREVFAVLFLNRANKVNHFEIISEGGITGTVADPRIIMRRALEYNAVSLVLCHNHPSGSLRPSKADEEITAKIQHAARYFDIKVLDHLIISNEGFYSFADEGLI